MNPNEVLKLHDQIFEAWNKHDVSKFLELCDEKIVWKDVGSREEYRGKKGAGDFYNNWLSAFPDFKLVAITKLATDDSIAVELEFSGTNKGNLKVSKDVPEIPATNKRVVANKGCYFGKVKNGKFTEVRTYPDLAGMMMQLGLMPEPAAFSHS